MKRDPTKGVHYRIAALEGALRWAAETACFVGLHDTDCETFLLRLARLTPDKAIEAAKYSMPKQGVASSFTFGEGFGLWQGILAGLNIPFDLVTPQAWKKELMSGAAKEKDASRIVAQRLFPTVDLSLKKHHGRSDALLIAEYRRRRG